MGTPIREITIKGYKSIRDLEKFELESINILIGANGAGKSNFVDFFRLLRELVEQRLQLTIAKKGGADAHLFLGPKTTDRIMAHLYFAANGYEFSLEPTTDDRLVFGYERMFFHGPYYGVSRYPLGSGHDESKLKDKYLVDQSGNVSHYVYPAVSSWVVYHFHDTSETAAMRRQWTIRDNERLLPDAANLASFLWMLKQEHESVYEIVRDTVQLVAPFSRIFYCDLAKVTVMKQYCWNGNKRIVITHFIPANFLMAPCVLWRWLQHYCNQTHQQQSY